MSGRKVVYGYQKKKKKLHTHHSKNNAFLASLRIYNICVPNMIFLKMLKMSKYAKQFS